jgi:hypothetical protein
VRANETGSDPGGPAPNSLLVLPRPTRSEKQRILSSLQGLGSGAVKANLRGGGNVNAAAVQQRGVGLSHLPEEADPATVGAILQRLLAEPAFSQAADEVRREIAIPFQSRS